MIFKSNYPEGTGKTLREAATLRTQQEQERRMHSQIFDTIVRPNHLNSSSGTTAGVNPYESYDGSIEFVDEKNIKHKWFIECKERFSESVNTYGTEMLNLGKIEDVVENKIPEYKKNHPDVEVDFYWIAAYPLVGKMFRWDIIRREACILTDTKNIGKDTVFGGYDDKIPQERGFISRNVADIYDYDPKYECIKW